MDGYRIFLKLFLLLFMGLSFAANAKNKWYSSLTPLMSAKTFTYTENMPVDAFSNDFEGDFPENGNFEFTHNKYQIGLGYKGFELSFFQRQDYYFRTIGDTFNLIYMDQNDWEFPLDEVFNIYLHVQKVEAEGIVLGYRFNPTADLDLYLGGSYFESQDVLYGQIEGQIWQTEERPFGDLIVDYIYTEEVLLDRPLTPPASGYGYGFDVALTWRLYDRLTFELLLEDIAGRIHWKHAPHTYAQMVSDRNRIDENGQPYKVPTLQGKHDFQDATQKLPLHRLIALAYTYGKFVVTGEQEVYDKVIFNRLLLGYQPINGLKVEGGYDFQSKAKSLEFWTPYFALLVATDDFDLKRSKNIRMEIKARYSF